MHKYFVGAEDSDESTKRYADKYLKIGNGYTVTYAGFNDYKVEVSMGRWFYFPTDIFVDSYREFIIKKRKDIIEMYRLK
jgi:hypothetical protein